MLILPDRALRRSLHLCPRLKLAYVNNPKVACSSIKLALQRSELQDPDYLPTSVHDHSTSPLLTWPDVWGAGDLAGYFTFSFVRHPFSRLRSAYLNKIVTGQKQGRPREMAGFARDYCPSFEEFVLAICDQDPMHHNPHWRGQALGLSMGLIRYDFIGRLEDFTSGWRHLATRFDLPDPAPRAGRSTQPDQAGLEFNSAMKSAVMRCYHDDFHEFGYKGADFI